MVENKVNTSNPNMKWQSVSAFCFLRFIVPAILHPHTFGLCHGENTRILIYSNTNINCRHASTSCSTVTYVNSKGASKLGKPQHGTRLNMRLIS